MQPGASLRLLGVAIPDVSDYGEAVPSGKWSQFFGGLARRFELVGVVRPALSRTANYTNLVRTFHPRLSRWKGRAAFNSRLLAERTAALERDIRRYTGSYDLIVQLQTLFAPGRQPRTPYVIYTDNTMALTQRLYPQGASLSAKAAAHWIGFEADVCRSAATVFTCSEFARESVVSDYGVAPERVVAIGAGANQVLPSLRDKDYTRRRAIFAGVDFTRKGGEILVAAWAQVEARVPDAELIIVGPSRAPKTGRAARIRWFGHVDRAALAELYRSASVFVMPSLFEPWGFVFFEAMGHGLPCVGTTRCAMPEMISDGVNGRLVPPGGVEALADALVELLTDQAKTEEMGRAAHAWVLRTARWSEVTERLALHLPVPTPSGT